MYSIKKNEGGSLPDIYETENGEYMVCVTHDRYGDYCLCIGESPKKAFSKASRIVELLNKFGA